MRMSRKTRKSNMLSLDLKDMQHYGGMNCRLTDTARASKKIKSWDRMVAKMKAKFIPRDYQITLFRRMQNLRQKLMSVKKYTEEFYKINIRAGHRESDDEKVARYMNGLRYDIQDEMSMMTIWTVEDAYQMALKAEEKLSRKQGQRGRGRSQARGKIIAQDRTQKSKEEGKKPQTQPERGGSSQGRQYVDRNTFPRARGRGRGRGGEVKCFTCGKVGHKSYECPDRKKEGGKLTLPKLKDKMLRQKMLRVEGL
jgi:hypothetical protein